MSLLDSWDPFVQEKCSTGLASMFALDPKCVEVFIAAGGAPKLSKLSQEAYTKTVREVKPIAPHHIRQ